VFTCVAMAKVIVVLFSFVCVVTHAARTQGKKSSFQADISTDEVAVDNCPGGSFLNSEGNCVCEQSGDVCTIDGNLDCPRGGDDEFGVFLYEFSPICKGCTCVAGTEYCKGGGKATKLEGGFGCSCDWGDLCTRGGTLSCPSPNELSHATYPTDCEDCLCVKKDTVCPSGTTYEFGKCECGSGQVCTRDGEFADCGVQKPAQFEPECIDCHCVDEVNKAVCPGSNDSPNALGDCSCPWGSYCSTDDGVSANCPSFFKTWLESDQRHFHHWCKNCECYPTPTAKCPDSAETLFPGVCYCEGTKNVFESSCDDCTCV